MHHNTSGIQCFTKQLNTLNTNTTKDLLVTLHINSAHSCNFCVRIVCNVIQSHMPVHSNATSWGLCKPWYVPFDIMIWAPSQNLIHQINLLKLWIVWFSYFKTPSITEAREPTRLITSDCVRWSHGSFQIVVRFSTPKYPPKYMDIFIIISSTKHSNWPPKRK